VTDFSDRPTAAADVQFAVDDQGTANAAADTKLEFCSADFDS
jgi:hypothetical protein